MGTRQISKSVYRISAGAGVFLIDHEGVTIVDTGLPGRAEKVLNGVRSIGRNERDVKDILITHYHLDHVGNVTRLAEATGAQVWAPEGDADLIREGGKVPPMRTEGVLGKLFSLFIKEPNLRPTLVHNVMRDGERIPVAGTMTVVGTPGHTPGHVSLLWEKEGVLFAGDAAAHLFFRPGPLPVNEDPRQAQASFNGVAQLRFEVAGFGHGRPLTRNAAATFRHSATGPR